MESTFVIEGPQATVLVETTTIPIMEDGSIKIAHQIESLNLQGASASDNSISENEENSDDSGKAKNKLPTFTNEVIIIRPTTFYENVDCQSDNKFMKNSGLQR